MKRLLLAPFMAFSVVALAGTAVSAQAISNTGPGSTNAIQQSNQCTSTVNNNTNVNVSGNANQNANSGNVTSSGNTSSGNASSGNASNGNSTTIGVSVTKTGGNGCTGGAPVVVNTPQGQPQYPSDPAVIAAAPDADPQVIAPVGGIDTGAGGATSVSMTDLLGLTASLGLLAAGLLRARKVAPLTT